MVELKIKKQILVVENEECIKFLLQGLLEQAGYVVDVASNAKEALKLLEYFNYSAIVMDIKLNGMNGVELCLDIRKTNREVFIVAITGLKELVEQADLHIAGFNEIIEKPFIYKPLLALLKERL